MPDFTLGYRHLTKNPYYTQNPFAARSMSEIAFHEKAGWSQGNSGFIVSFCSFSQRRVFLRRVATVAMLPSALSRSDSFARCTLGVLVSAGAAICLAPCVLLSESGTWARRLTQSPELGVWAFWLLLPKNVSTLCCRRHRCRVAIVQRFVHFSAYPQVMQ
jgi:hypothetical protein